MDLIEVGLQLAPNSGSEDGIREIQVWGLESSDKGAVLIGLLELLEGQFAAIPKIAAIPKVAAIRPCQNVIFWTFEGLATAKNIHVIMSCRT